MNTTAQPRVSVVMPVYNGARTLAQSIQSVLGQTYANWDLTIGNNRSTDRTAEIAAEFAANDPRIRVHTYPEHVNVIGSHNNAFRLISDEAKYCNALGADDWLLPQYLEQKVAVAEAHPTVGMVCSYAINGTQVNGLKLPYPSPCVAGREIVRARLLRGFKGIGGPSTVLIRADIVRKHANFYNPLNYAGDIEAYLDLLQTHDLGFVHQVLVAMRAGEASPTTSFLERVNSYVSDDVHEATKFGPMVLTEEECKARLRATRTAYYQMLAQAVIPPRNREFWNYHFNHVSKMGYPISRLRLSWFVLLTLLDKLANPKRTIEGALRRL